MLSGLKQIWKPWKMNEWMNSLFPRLHFWYMLYTIDNLIHFIRKFEKWNPSSRGLVVRQKTHDREVLGSIPHYGDHFSGTIHLDQSLEQKLWKTLTWHCCICCNPANGRVDFEEWSAYKIQLHGIEWIVSLLADWDQSPTKKIVFALLSQT